MHPLFKRSSWNASEDVLDTSASDDNGADQSEELDLRDQLASDVGDEDTS
jgi:hypothetical protein